MLCNATCQIPSTSEATTTLSQKNSNHRRPRIILPLCTPSLNHLQWIEEVLHPTVRRIGNGYQFQQGRRDQGKSLLARWTYLIRHADKNMMTKMLSQWHLQYRGSHETVQDIPQILPRNSQPVQQNTDAVTPGSGGGDRKKAPIILSLQTRSKTLYQHMNAIYAAYGPIDSDIYSEYLLLQRLQKSLERFTVVTL